MISSLSFAILDYPDNIHKVVWLSDASVQFIDGKHIVLFIIAMIILILGIVYTALLFSWQWIVKWVKICVFMEQYHAPYTPKHRYLPGLLLLICVVLYIIVSVINVSNSPEMNLIAISLVMILIVIYVRKNSPVSKKSPIEYIDITCYIHESGVVVCCQSVYISWVLERMMLYCLTFLYLSHLLNCLVFSSITFTMK